MRFLFIRHLSTDPPLHQEEAGTVTKRRVDIRKGRVTGTTSGNAGRWVGGRNEPRKARGLPIRNTPVQCC